MVAHTVVDAAESEDILQLTVKIFMLKRSQAVRLPKEFQFATSEVLIRKQGDDVILSPRPKDWSSYLTSGPVASEEFMEQVEDLPAQDRNLRRIRPNQPLK
jgi:antitoxin VapB